VNSGAFNDGLFTVHDSDAVVLRLPVLLSSKIGWLAGAIAVMFTSPKVGLALGAGGDEAIGNSWFAVRTAPRAVCTIGMSCGLSFGMSVVMVKMPPYTFGVRSGGNGSALGVTWMSAVMPAGIEPESGSSTKPGVPVAAAVQPSATVPLLATVTFTGAAGVKTPTPAAGQLTKPPEPISIGLVETRP